MSSIDYRELCEKLVDFLSEVEEEERDIFSIEKLKKIIRKIDAGVIMAPSSTMFVEDLIDSITNHTCKYRKNQGEKGCAKKGKCDMLHAMPACELYERLWDE